MNLTDLLGNNEADWMLADGRPCASPIDDPFHIGTHADTWYPRDKYYDQATRLCAGCPVKTKCLQYALDHNEEHGIWGGTTPKQRETLMRRGAA